jgi:hypothetical protein
VICDTAIACRNEETHAIAVAGDRLRTRPYRGGA